MKKLILLVLLIAPSLWAQTNPLDPSYKPAMDCTTGDYPTNIRLSGDMDKLMQTTSSPSALASATVCGTFYGTQNEWVDFQLHVQAPVGGYSSLNVAVSSFSKTTGPGGSYTIPNTYRSIIPYREAYQNITAGNATAAGGNVAYLIGGSSGAGFIPDALIPFTDPYENEATNANPFSVAANNNQSYWFDILIPAAAPSGWYSGTVTVSNGGTTLATMPVDLGVWQWPAAQGGKMPTQPTLPVMENATNQDYGFACIQLYSTGKTLPATCPFLGAASTDAGVTTTEQALAPLFLDHRMSFTIPTNPTATDPSTGTWNTNWKWILNGTAPPGSIPVPIMTGARDDTIEYYTSGGIANPAAQNWLTYFNALGIINSVNPFFYAVDEPGSNCTGSGKNWQAAINAATAVHADTPSGQVLVTGSIEDATTCSATTSVDILVVNVEQMDRNFSTDEGNCGTTTYPYCLDRASYNTWLAGAANRVVASYFGCQNSGTCNLPHQGQALDSYYNVNVDGTGVSNRIEEWITYFHRQTAQLYFSSFQCWQDDDNGCPNTTSIWGPNGNLHFGNQGDGTELYASTSNGTNYILSSGGTALTNPIFVPSIRFELRRDGIQDYEYLHLLGTMYGSNTCPGSIACSTWVNNEILTFADSAFNFNNNPVAAGSGSHTSFTGDITDARTAIGNQMQTLTNFGGTPVVPAPTSLIAQVAKIWKAITGGL